MGTPVKVSDELVQAAKEVAGLASRSINKQIEHWAELGRAVEHLVPMPDLAALKANLADPSNAQKQRAAREALERLVRMLADTADRDAALGLIRDTGKPVYGAAPGREDRVMQVWPDGRKVVGRFVGREFVADESPAR